MSSYKWFLTCPGVLCTTTTAREGLGRILPQDARTGAALRTDKTLLWEHTYKQRNSGYAKDV